MISVKRSLVPALTLLLVCACAAPIAFAQQGPTLTAPRPSPKASVTQIIGVTDVTINYSRPAVKGRTIWGEPWGDDAKGEATLDNQNTRPKGAPIVPWGHVWRAGANEATQFIVTDDVLINGQKLAAGKYSLHTIPTKEEWTIIFNKNWNQWGAFNYKEADDALRIKVKPSKAKAFSEKMTFTISQKGKVSLLWGDRQVDFNVQ